MGKVNFLSGIIRKNDHGRLYAKARNGNRIYKDVYQNEVILTGVDKNKKVIKRVIQEIDKDNKDTKFSKILRTSKPSIFKEKSLKTNENGITVFKVTRSGNLPSVPDYMTTYYLKKGEKGLEPMSMYHEGKLYLAASEFNDDIIMRGDFRSFNLPKLLFNTKSNWQKISNQINEFYSRFYK